MISQAINSGALNVTQFPTTGTGVSIVELQGTAEVVTNVSQVFLIFKGKAKGTGSAVAANAGITFKRRVGAAVQATANARQIPSGVNYLRSAYGVASAVLRNPVAQRRIHFSAIQPARAVAGISTTIHLPRNGATSAAAVTTANAVKKVFRGAVVTAGGNAVAGSRIEPNRSAIVAAGAITNVPQVKFELPLGASVQPTAVGTFGINFIHRPSGNVKARADIQPVSFYIKKPVGAATTCLGKAANISAVQRYHLSAVTVCQVISVAAGLDFSTNMPAPDTRRMVVPARPLMKVEA